MYDFSNPLMGGVPKCYFMTDKILTAGFFNFRPIAYSAAISLVLFWIGGLCFSLSAEEEIATRQFLATYYESLADQLYDTKELPGHLELAVANYQKAAGYLTVTRETDWKTIRCYWVLATKASSPQKRETYFNEGVRLGKQAVKNYPNSSQAHSWLALIIGSSAMDEGVVKTLYNKELIRSGLETAISLDQSNTNAFAGLATWYYYVPTLLGGDKQKALQLIEQAIALEPEYTAPQIIKAEFLMAEQNYSEALSTLKGVLATKQPVVRGDGVEDKLKAEKMLQEIIQKRLND